MLSVLSAHAWTSEKVRQENMEKLRADLADARTDTDSIRILYDLFDISRGREKADAGWQLLRIGQRSKNMELVSDIVPQLSVLEMHDMKALDKLIEISEILPEGDTKKATQLFVKVEKAFNEAKYMPAEQRREAMVNYAKEDLTPKYDIYEDIHDLYRIIVFIRANAQGNLYMEYLLRLEKMISELPEENKFLRNLFYTTAANHYTITGFKEKAIETDRKLLEIIDNLDAEYKKKGRKYRSYDRYYYICYRRMLSNFEALSLDEVKDLYARCALLAEKDFEVANDFVADGRPSAYRNMAEKDYVAAIPYLKKAINANSGNYVKLRLASMLVAAADSVGDNDALLVGLQKYNSLMNEIHEHSTEEMAMELQMRYDVNSLKAERDKLMIEQKDLELITNQKLISITLIALFILVIALMFLYRNHFRLLNKTRQLQEDNDHLRSNIESILNDGIPAGTTDLYQKTESSNFK